MIDTKKIYKLIEAINTYYAFALLVYAAVLFVFSNTEIFVWVFVVATPFIAGWTGWLLKGFIARRTQRHGFRLVSDSMTYEIRPRQKYTLRYRTVIKAANNNLMVYPIGYQWTGNGEEKTPILDGKDQQLLAPIIPSGKKTSIKSTPYRFTTSPVGEWHYWFISLNPPVDKGDTVEIKYAQDFIDKKGTARPHIIYFVRIPLKELSLNVKFEASKLPKTVTSGYFKLSDPTHFYAKTGVEYSPDKQWATWTIKKPKRGYCYQIKWQ